MTSIYIIWFALICIEIFRNKAIIEVKRRRPTYWYSQLLRITTGFIFWIVAKALSDITYWQWWAMIPWMAFTFWFIFDYGLNQVRDNMSPNPGEKYAPWSRPFYYLNPKGSWLDRFQCKHPNAFVWFWWKLILMIGAIALFHYGLDATWTAKW